MQDAQDYASLENIGLFETLGSYKELCQDTFLSMLSNEKKLQYRWKMSSLKHPVCILTNPSVKNSPSK